MKPIKGQKLAISTEGSIDTTKVSIDGKELGGISAVNIEVGTEECSAWVCYVNPDNSDVSVQGIDLT